MNYNKILLFTLLNILSFLLLSVARNGGLYYFHLIVISVIIPNLFGLIINLGLWTIIKNRTTKFIWFAILFLTNEIAFGIYEKRIIFFGTIKPTLPPNIIQTDQSDFVFISASSIIAAAILTMFTFNKKKSSNISNEQPPRSVAMQKTTTKPACNFRSRRVAKRLRSHRTDNMVWRKPPRFYASHSVQSEAQATGVWQLIVYKLRCSK